MRPRTIADLRPSEGVPSHASAHLVPLERGWSLWRSVCVRGAGFPANWVQELASADCARSFDRVLAREAQCEASRLVALECCERGNRLGAEGAGSALTTAMKRLRAGRPPEPFAATAEVAEAIGAFTAAQGALAAERTSARELFAEACSECGRVLRAAARDPRFRKAVLWQNRAALKGTIEAFLRTPVGATDSKTRERERLIANYLQRYCVKNDTIGFFGPVGWASIVDHGEALSLRPGASLVAKRTVYFETWGIELLAGALAAESGLRPHLVPRRMPTVRLEGTTLFHGLGRASALPLEYACIVAACDGERTALQIAASLARDPGLGLSGEDEVLALLEQLVEKRVVTWTIEIPTTLAHPERRLRALLSNAPAFAAREQALSGLAELEGAREAIAKACDDEHALDRGMAEIEATFERLTGGSAKRRAGEAYAGRTLVFEDCVRDLELELGPPLLARLAPPLVLLLESARWYTFEIGRRYSAAFASIYERLRQDSGASAVEFVQFLAAAEGLFSGSQYQPSAIVREVIDDLRARWAAALELPNDARRVEREVSALRPKIEALFHAPHPGWPGARYHSPDIMIAARSCDAIRRGEYQLVLGELHTGDNTASNPVFIHQHPEPAELVRAVEHDLPEPRISPVVPKERSTRADQLSLCRYDYDVEFGATRSARPRRQVLAVSDLVLEMGDHGLSVRTRDARLCFPILAFFEHYLKLESIAHFSLLPASAHSPRVTVDDLVVARERWRFEPSELTFAAAPDPMERFLGARRWAARHGLPRLVFAKIPEEVKPSFVDFDSPAFVELLAKLARRASSLTLSEMLPAIDQTWLADREGRTYTSELRVVAVDHERWRAS